MPARRPSLMLSACACALFLQAEEPSTNIPPLEITAASQTTGSAEVYEALRAEPGLVVNSQGGSQNDLSVRGSSFSGAGLALGGLTLRNPQTEHFNTELPIPAGMLSRPTVRTGLGNQGGHLTGTAHFDLLPVTGKQQVETGFGSDQRNWQSLLVQHLLTKELGLGIFGGHEQADGVDYDDNDYKRNYAGGHTQYRADDVQVDTLVAHQEKEFGARGYYGVSDTLPANEKTEDTLVYLAARKGDLDADYLRGGVAWRQFRDDYELPTLDYRNQNRSRISSAFADGRTLEVNSWALGWRTDLDQESLSGSLGEFDRTRGGVSLLPQWQGDRLKVTTGARSEFFSEESPHYLPQAGVDYKLSDTLTAFSSYTETVRLPSYTELHNDSPASQGNSGLQPQPEQQTEAGFKGLPSEHADWKIAAFHRRSKNTVDWMKGSPEARWAATDIGALDIYGIETRGGWYPAKNVEMQLAHTWVYKNREPADFDQYASRYALDYPEHLVQGSLLWRPVKPVEIGTVQSLRWQTENKIRQGGAFGADSSFVIRFTPPQADYATIALTLNNAWDDDFQPFPGQRPAERFAGVSLTLAW